MSQLIGRTFGGRFLIERCVGRGGMGAVFLARHLTMGKPVALKVLARHLSDEPTQIERFNQEAQNSSRLRHPNTIRVFDFGTSEDGYLYLAMEYLEGLELSKVLRRDAPLSAERAVHILTQIVKSIAEAHNIGLIHRDVKPDNIFLSNIYGERDFVKVLDFGIAKVVGGEELVNLTQTGFICGTPSYLAPELAMGTSITPATDVYSIGVVAYEMLTGRLPFKADTPIAVVMKHIHDPVPPFVPDLPVPGRLKLLIHRMLAKDPAARPASAEAVLASLEQVFESDGDAAVAGKGARTRQATTDQVQPVSREQQLTVDTGAPPAGMSAEQRNAQTSAIPNPTGSQPITRPRGLRWWLPLAAAGALGALLVALIGGPADRDSAISEDPIASEPAVAPSPAARPEASPDPAPAPTVMAPVEAAAPASVEVWSTPAGASIYEAGKVIGQTPTRVDLPPGPDSHRSLTLRLEGYEDLALSLVAGAKPVVAKLIATPAVKPSKRGKASSRTPRKARSGKSGARKPKAKSSDRWRDFESP